MAGKKKRLLLVDDEENMLHMLSTYLAKREYQVVTAINGTEGVRLVNDFSPDMILCDLKMPNMDGLEFLNRIKDKLEDVPVIMMSAYATVDIAVEAMKLGAYDFITKPFRPDEIACILEKAEKYIGVKKENIALKEKVQELQGGGTFSSIIGKSSGIRNIIEQARKVAAYDATVLITGESGTGKELLAKGIHSCSKRCDGPLVSVNCGSIPANLLESEFFGYLQGAFTGADKDQIGLFEAANGGTIFLDEIGELPLELQVKLLRVLQEQEIRPVGAQKTKKIDVRLLTATAKNLEEEVASGSFRQDLFYRLNVVVLEIPPLRQRKEDIPFLCSHFIDQFNLKMNLGIESVSAGGMAILMAQDWSGNVRELENSMERAMIFSEGTQVTKENLLPFFDAVKHSRRIDDFLGTQSLKKAQKILEKRMIGRAMQATEGNKSKAAKMLEISYPSLLTKIREYAIEGGT